MSGASAAGASLADHGWRDAHASLEEMARCIEQLNKNKPLCTGTAQIKEDESHETFEQLNKETLELPKKTRRSRISFPFGGS